MNNQEYATIYLMRHAETEYNVKKIYQGGNVDSDLTEQGKKQARKRAKSLAKVHFDAVYTSDLARTQRTAELVVAERNLEAKATAFLRERFFGVLDGNKFEDMKKQYAHLYDEFEKLSEKERYHYTFNNELEPAEQLRSRMFTALREIALANLSKTVLVISHGAVMRGVMSALDPKYYEMRFKNTGYVILKCDGVEFEILHTEDVVPKSEMK